MKKKGKRNDMSIAAVRKYMVPKGKWGRREKDLLSAAWDESPLTLSPHELGLMVSSVLNEVQGACTVEEVLSMSIDSDLGATGSRVSDCAVNFIYGCANLGRCAIGRINGCNQAWMENGRMAIAERAGSNKVAMSEFRATRKPQWALRGLMRSYRPGLRYMFSTNSEVCMGTPDHRMVFELLLAIAVANPLSTFILATHNPEVLASWLMVSRFRGMLEAGLIKNINFMLSACTQAEVDNVAEAVSGLPKGLQLSIFLSFRPVLEDGIVVPDSLLMSSWLKGIVSSYLIDWYGVKTDAAVQERWGKIQKYTDAALKRIKASMSRLGVRKPILFDTFDQTVPVRKVKAEGRTVYAERGLSRQTIRTRVQANPAARLLLMGGDTYAVNGSNGTLPTIIGASNVQFAVVPRRLSGALTGPIVNPNKRFLAAQLEAPVTG